MNNKECMVSIVCITYNQSEYIKKAIDSMLSQKTDFNFEIIIHDDASTDGTNEILKDYEKRYPKLINVIYEKENQWSQNNGFFRKILNNVTHGKYIALCEGDDYWLDNYKLQLQFESLEEHPEYDMCACRAITVSANSLITLGEIRPKNENGILSVEEVIAGGGNFVATAGLFFRKSMIDNIMDFERIMDLDYSFQIKGALRNGIYYIDKPMAVYRRYSSGSVTENIASNENAMKRHCIMEKEILRVLDKDTGGKYHNVISNRIMDYDITCYDQLMGNKEEILQEISKTNGSIYIWGMGVRGKQLEKFCRDINIKICGVCDIVNDSIGIITGIGNIVVSTEEVLQNAAVILASVNAVYEYLTGLFHGDILNMQKYMPRI